MPFSYLWKAFRASKYGSQFYTETSEPIGWVETIVRWALIYGANELFISKLPYAIFRTKNLPVITDFFFKRVNGAFLMVSLAQSPIDSYVIRCFRKNYKSARIKEE